VILDVDGCGIFGAALPVGLISISFVGAARHAPRPSHSDGFLFTRQLNAFVIETRMDTGMNELCHAPHLTRSAKRLRGLPFGYPHRGPPASHTDRLALFSFAFVHSVEVPSSGAGDPPPPPLPPSYQQVVNPLCMLSDLTSARDASAMLVIGRVFYLFSPWTTVSPFGAEEWWVDGKHRYTSDLCVFQVSVRSGKQRLKGGRHGSRRFVWGIGRVGKLIIEKRRGFG
jgi:hypothetical protein